MKYHDSRLPHQFQVTHVGVNNQNGIACTDPNGEVLKDMGSWEPVEAGHPEKGWKFERALLIGVEAWGSGTFEVIPLFCPQADFRPVLQGNVLRIYNVNGQTGVYGRIGAQLWVFLCTNKIDAAETPRIATHGPGVGFDTIVPNLKALSAPKYWNLPSANENQPSGKINLRVLRSQKVILPNEGEHTFKFCVERTVPEALKDVLRRAETLAGIPGEVRPLLQNGDSPTFERQITEAIAYLRKFQLLLPS